MPDRSSNPLIRIKALVNKGGKHTEKATKHAPKIPAPRKPVEEHKHRKKEEKK